MDQPPQTFANHTRYDPPFHFFALAVFAINIIIAGYFLVVALLSGQWLIIVAHIWLFIFALAMLVLLGRVRIYPIKLQDRIIRLEERLRLMSLLQEPLRSRVGELQDAQLIGLRFASDEELPGLVKRALDEKLSRDDIKKAIVKWRPDNSRV